MLHSPWWLIQSLVSGLLEFLRNMSPSQTAAILRACAALAFRQEAASDAGDHAPWEGTDGAGDNTGGGSLRGHSLIIAVKKMLRLAPDRLAGVLGTLSTLLEMAHAAPAIKDQVRVAR